MSLSKKFGDLRGINNRTNDLVKPSGFLRDALNVTIEDSDYNSLYYRKRPGFGVVHNVAGSNGLVKYEKQDELLLLDDTPTIWDGSVASLMKTSEVDPLSGSVNQIADWAEINNIVYISKEDKDLLKYDGHRIYKAGLPGTYTSGMVFIGGAGTINPGGPSTFNIKYTFEFEHTDKQGNIVISDGSFYDFDDSPGTFPADSKIQGIIYAVFQNVEGFAVSLTSDIDGFNSVYAEVTTRFPVAAKTTSASLPSNDTVTIDVSVGHTVEIGDSVYLRHTIAGFDSVLADSPEDLLWESFKVIGTAPTNITVDNPKNLAVFVKLRVGTFEGVTNISSILMNVYRADNGGIGALGESFYFESLGIRIDSSFSIKYEDTGDSELVTADPYITPELINIPPNQGKYIEYHKGLLMQAGVRSRITKTDGSFFFKNREHELFYSSTDGFAGLENFVLGGNSLIIGDDSEGPITAIHSHNDFLIVFKKRGIHYISGNLFTGAFRVDKLHGSEVGCFSHGSIQEVMGSVFFLSERGIYATVGGGSPKEITQSITPYFLDGLIDKTRATSTYVFREQKYYLFVPFVTPPGGRMFVFDVEYQSWLVWDVRAEGGLSYYKDSLYAAHDNELIREQVTKTDSYLSGAAINAYIFSHFEHLGEPSIYKKFINIKVFSLNNINYTLTIESFKDWVDSTVKTNSTIDFTATQRFDKVKVLAGDNKAHSFAVKFSNNVVGEDIGITGWELEYETPYGKMKE